MQENIHLYGIKNCDTVRKSIKWLTEKNIENKFHDLKSETLEPALIKEWLSHIDKDKLINKRSLTWRNISSEDKSLTDEVSIIQLIQDNPTLVKRPVLFNGMFWSVGFSPEDWDKLFL